MQVTKITIARLFNLGSYEHVRYEISAEIKDGESATDALVGLEKIMEGLTPEAKCYIKSLDELNLETRRVNAMRELLAEGEEPFRRRHSYFEGTPDEYISRCQASLDEEISKRAAWAIRSARARKLLDNLGGAAVWKDAKLDWEDDGHQYEEEP